MKWWNVINPISPITLNGLENWAILFRISNFRNSKAMKLTNWKSIWEGKECFSKKTWVGGSWCCKKFQRGTQFSSLLSFLSTFVCIRGGGQFYSPLLSINAMKQRQTWFFSLFLLSTNATNAVRHWQKQTLKQG